LEAAGFEVGDVTEEDSQEEEGTVLSQNPAANTRERPGTAVNLVVSGGPGTVSVPNVFCQDLSAAQERVEDAGLRFDVSGSQFSNECSEGTVAAQSPEGGTEVQAGSTVRVVESRGPEPTPTTPSPTDIIDD
jgi:serine/threonine-protein kinase